MPLDGGAQFGLALNREQRHNALLERLQLKCPWPEALVGKLRNVKQYNAPDHRCIYFLIVEPLLGMCVLWEGQSPV